MWGTHNHEDKSEDRNVDNNTTVTHPPTRRVMAGVMLRINKQTYK